MGLVDDLTAQFGLTQDQAQGAIGAIGRVAREKLDPAIFAQLGGLVPGLDGMIGKAPQPGGGLFGMLGGKLGEMAKMASVFKALGIDAGRIQPIAQAILDFIRAKGSPELVGAINALVGKLGG